MTKLTEINVANLSDVREAMRVALAKVEAEFGLKISIGSLKFTSESFKAELSAMIGGEDPMMLGVDPKYVQEINKFRDYKHLFKKEVTLRGTKFTIVGMKPRTSAGTMVARDNMGRLKLIPTLDVTMALNSQAAPLKITQIK